MTNDKKRYSLISVDPGVESPVKEISPLADNDVIVVRSSGIAAGSKEDFEERYGKADQELHEELQSIPQSLSTADSQKQATFVVEPQAVSEQFTHLKGSSTESMQVLSDEGNNQEVPLSKMRIGIIVALVLFIIGFVLYYVFV